MWSVGAKWNIGKEEFIKDIDWINYLNLRATYGIMVMRKKVPRR